MLGTVAPSSQYLILIANSAYNYCKIWSQILLRPF